MSEPIQRGPSSASPGPNYGVDGGYPPPPPPPPPTSGGRTSGSNRTPLLLGLAALALIVLGGLAFVLLNNRGGAPAPGTPGVAATGVPGATTPGDLASNPLGAGSSTAAYLPADSVMFLEARLDLPGDQRQQLTDFLSRFPDLAGDPTSRISTLLDSLLGTGSRGSVSYSRDIQPWSTGQFGIGILGAPQGGAQASPVPPVVVVVGVSDPDAARTTMERVLSSNGASTTQEQYAGTTINSAGSAGAYAVTNDALIVAASAGNVRSALDVKQGTTPGLGTSASAASLARLRGDRIGTFYLDPAQLLPLIQQSGAGTPATLQQLQQGFAAFRGPIVVGLHAESDRLVLEYRALLSADLPRPTVRESTLAGKVPASAFAYFEIRDAGKTIAETLKRVRENPPPAGSSQEQQLQQFEALLGPDVDQWLGDVAVSVGAAGFSPTGGLVAAVSNEELARSRVEGITRRMAAGSEPATSDYKGTTVTRVGTSGIAYAFREGLLVLGQEGFVQGVLDTSPEQSLAAQSRFIDALGGATANAGVVYVDLAAIRAGLLTQLPESDRASYERYRGLVDPLDRLVLVSTMEGDEAVSRVVLFVR